MAKEAVLQLMRDQSSCARAAYQAGINKIRLAGRGFSMTVKGSFLGYGFNGF
jgi:hypothetical protein